jgi:glucose-6-phosphate isomerase
MPGARVDEVRASDLRGLVSDDRALEALVASGDPVVYRVVTAPGGLAEGLGLAVTTIEPGEVGDELFMTRGHVHRDASAETYVCTEGHGGLLLSDGERAEWLELGPGDVAPIPAGRAHRTVNVGPERFSFLAVYELGAGNDYETVARRGMGARVLRFGDGYRVVS